MALTFPYPIKFIANNKKEFRVRVTKPNKRSWWLMLLTPDGAPIKVVKVSKTSPKLYYPTQNGGVCNGPQVLREIIKVRNSLEATNGSNQRYNRGTLR